MPVHLGLRPYVAKLYMSMGNILFCLSWTLALAIGEERVMAQGGGMRGGGQARSRKGIRRPVFYMYDNKSNKKNEMNDFETDSTQNKRNRI